ncbi:MAG: lamin tail domain-containing protein, partial [Prevotella sp.]|nr:lamin tail domain-containing protein [Prevotella sp.]
MWSSLLSVILVINELMASNAGEVMSPAINFDSWIELYNPGDEDVDLGGMYLSNIAEAPTFWRMPSTMGTVPAKGFKVIWLGSNNIKSNQAPFRLDCDGGTVYLSDSNWELVTSLTYPQTISRTAWARKQDGGEEWGWTAQATPGATNATATFADKRLPAP